MWKKTASASAFGSFLVRPKYVFAFLIALLKCGRSDFFVIPTCTEMFVKRLQVICFVISVGAEGVDSVNNSMDHASE